MFFLRPFNFPCHFIHCRNIRKLVYSSLLYSYFLALTKLFVALLEEAENAAECTKSYNKAFHIFTNWFAGKPVELFKLSNSDGDTETLLQHIKVLCFLQILFLTSVCEPVYYGLLN